MNRPLNLLFIILSSIASLVLHGCYAAPSKVIVRSILVQHFEARNYKVKEIEIGDIVKMPIRDMQYMGTPGYDVNVVSITLIRKDVNDEHFDDRDREIKFNNATVRIKQRTGPDKEWIIVNISGIAVP